MTKALHFPKFSFLSNALFNFDMSWFDVVYDPQLNSKHIFEIIDADDIDEMDIE